jgi:coatomer protein complex subunit gamma
MLQAMERFIKQAIVDKDPSVSSGALVSSLHLFEQGNKEVVKRWVNEVQEALNRPVGLIQYHGLGLMYNIKQHDKMAVTKIIQTLSRGNMLRSPYAFCMLIRYTYKVMNDEGGMEGCAQSVRLVINFCSGRIAACLKCWKTVCAIVMKW